MSLYYYLSSFLKIFLALIFINLFVTVDIFAKPVFNAENAFKYLQKQCSFGPRNPNSHGHSKTKDFLIKELKKFSENVYAQDFTYNSSNGALNLTNIIAIFGTNTKKKILLAAHWDTRPYADLDPESKNRQKPIIGANDGASGVAVLLELAGIFKLNPPPIQVIIVLFDGEDYGKTTNEMFLGSRYFAKNINKDWIPNYGILLDMIGDKNLDIYIEQNSWTFAPNVVQLVWEKAKELGLKNFHDKIGQAILDDHIPLLEIGIECINIIDFNYPYWHTLEDTPDKCSPKSLETIGKLLLGLIY